MLQIFIAWIYISLLCWIWGYALITLFTGASGRDREKIPCFYIVCFAGLSVIAVLSGLLSLVIPLGGITAQSILLIPALFILGSSKMVRSVLFLSVKELAARYHWATGLLAISLLILLLILGASLINHPDSMGYHLQTIKWIQEYRVIPGLVHINTQLGYQGLWYCLCALFSFSFIHTTAVTFINTTVLAWYLLFLIHEINKCLPTGKKANTGKFSTGVLYFLLLAFSCWSYVQVRLTATSASPDFIAALYVWLVFYLLFANDDTKKRAPSLMLIFFICCTAITIKLSALPVVVVMAYTIYHLVQLKKRRAILLLIIVAFITITPFITRNIITSGYIFFPSAFPDVVHADWKLSKELTVAEKKYITSFARIQHQVIKPAKPEPQHLPIPNWLPKWWQLRVFSDKLILFSLLSLLLLAAVTGKKIWKEANQTVIFSLILSVAALIFWFLQAPDLRFGFGFIVPVQGILISFYSSGYLNSCKKGKAFFPYCLTVFSFVIISYTLYRVSNYFSSQYIVQAAGAQKVVYRKINCGILTITIPLNGGCGNAPLPCIYYNDCSHFSARGNSITDGFRGN
ncbi:MAG: hypothetical protein ABJC98_14165 [Bacteroidota bacterium]